MIKLDLLANVQNHLNVNEFLHRPPVVISSISISSTEPSINIIYTLLNDDPLL